LTERGLEGYLDLPRKVESTRFRQASPYTKRLWVHHFVLTSEDDLDEEFAGWLGEAYEVGWGRPVSGDPPVLDPSGVRLESDPVPDSSQAPVSRVVPRTRP
jgi:hypothetical protein